MLSITFNTPGGNFSRSSSLPLLFISSAWAVGFVCNYKLLYPDINPCFFWFCPLFYFYLLPYLVIIHMLRLWNKFHIYLRLWGCKKLPKDVIYRQHSLWKYFLLLSISRFGTVVRTGLGSFFRICHNRELDLTSSIPTKLFK